MKDNCAIFFEAGHKSKGRAYTRVAERLMNQSVSVSFVTKQAAPLLQAADLLAWQSTKYVKDRRSGERGPRKDFLSLMEHAHDLNFLTWENGDRVVSVEMWPTIRRPKSTQLVRLRVDDGPIAYFYADDDKQKIPIVKVNATKAPRIGFDGMAYVDFVDIKDGPFSLAFDLAHWMEALAAFINVPPAMSIPGAPKNFFMYLKAQGIEIEQHGNDFFLVIRSHGDAAPWRFMVPRQMLKELRRALKQQL